LCAVAVLLFLSIQPFMLEYSPKEIIQELHPVLLHEGLHDNNINYEMLVIFSMIFLLIIKSRVSSTKIHAILTY
jgi:hypothetical protein